MPNHALCIKVPILAGAHVCAVGILSSEVFPQQLKSGLSPQGASLAVRMSSLPDSTYIRDVNPRVLVRLSTSVTRSVRL